MDKHVNCISPIEWDRNSEDNSMGDHEQECNIDIKEIQPICSQSSIQLDSNYRLPSKIKYLFQEARYFLIKSNNFENVSLAKVRNVWSTTRPNEARLNKAFYETRNVLLIFSVKESGKFQGYARLATPSNPNKHFNWVLPSHMNQRQLSGVFEIDWLSREEESFSKTNHLVNAWNEHKPVKIGRDGQEIEPSCGEFLCRLFPIDVDCPFNEIIDKAKHGPGYYRDNYGNNDTNDRKNSPTLIGKNRAEESYRAKNRDSFERYDHYRIDHRRSRSVSKRRGQETYHESSRSRDGPRRDNSDVFLNGNYEDYLREQNGFNRIDNHNSYEQRVDDFLRNIVKRERVVMVKHRRVSSDAYSKRSSSSRSSSSYYNKKRRRSRSYDRHSNRSNKGHQYVKRYRSRSGHRR